MLLLKDIAKWALIVLLFGAAGYFFRWFGSGWLAVIVWVLGVIVLLIFVVGNYAERPRVFLEEGSKRLFCPKCDSMFPESDFIDCSRDTVTNKHMCPHRCRSYKKSLVT